MSKSEISSGSPWKSDAEMTHKTLMLYHSGVSVAGLSDSEVRTLYERHVSAPQQGVGTGALTGTNGQK